MCRSDEKVPAATTKTFMQDDIMCLDIDWVLRSHLQQSSPKVRFSSDLEILPASERLDRRSQDFFARLENFLYIPSKGSPPPPPRSRRKLRRRSKGQLRLATPRSHSFFLARRTPISTSYSVARGIQIAMAKDGESPIAMMPVRFAPEHRHRASRTREGGRGSAAGLPESTGRKAAGVQSPTTICCHHQPLIHRLVSQRQPGKFASWQVVRDGSSKNQFLRLDGHEWSDESC